MELGQVLVSATQLEGDGAVVLLDLDAGTCSTVLPYRSGGIHATANELYVAAIDADLTVTRVEKYDREGLVWMRRVPCCIDTHALVPAGDCLAVCATGNNQVILLDGDGVEQKRWSPDEAAEQDSWHLNSLAYHEGRLLGTCFRRHPRFRGLSESTRGTGLLLDLETGQPLHTGLTMPHDPCRVSDGWLVNDSGNFRTLFFPDAGGEPRVVAQLTDFTRGLAVRPEVYVIGFSIHRSSKGSSGCAGVVVVDRRTLNVVKTIRIPFREVGHVAAAPSADVLAAVLPDPDGPRHCLTPHNKVIPEADRAGSVAAHVPFCPSAGDPDVCEMHLTVTNHGGKDPVHVWPDKALRYPLMIDLTARSPLPLPVLPGRSLTIHMAIDLSLCRYLLAPAAVRITLLQEGVARWQETDVWKPAVIDLPPAVRARAAELEATRQVVRTVEAQLLETRARLAPYEQLKPLSVGVTRRLSRLSLRYPAVSATVKRLLRRAG